MRIESKISSPAIATKMEKHKNSQPRTKLSGRTKHLTPGGFVAEALHFPSEDQAKRAVKTIKYSRSDGKNPTIIYANRSQKLVDIKKLSGKAHMQKGLQNGIKVGQADGKKLAERIKRIEELQLYKNPQKFISKQKLCEKVLPKLKEKLIESRRGNCRSGLSKRSIGNAGTNSNNKSFRKIAAMNKKSASKTSPRGAEGLQEANVGSLATPAAKSGTTQKKSRTPPSIERIDPKKPREDPMEYDEDEMLRSDNELEIGAASLQISDDGERYINMTPEDASSMLEQRERFAAGIGLGMNDMENNVNDYIETSETPMTEQLPLNAIRESYQVPTKAALKQSTTRRPSGTFTSNQNASSSSNNQVNQPGTSQQASSGNCDNEEMMATLNRLQPSRELNILMAILPKEYPSEVITPEAYISIEQTLNAALENFYRMQTGFMVKIHSFEAKQGAMAATCASVGSMNWLKISVEGLGFNLKCVNIEAANLRPAFTCWVGVKEDTFEMVRTNLSRQGIDTSQWVLLRKKEAETKGRVQGRSFIFLGDENLKRQTQQGDIRVQYKLCLTMATIRYLPGIGEKRRARKRENGKPKELHFEQKIISSLYFKVEIETNQQMPRPGHSHLRRASKQRSRSLCSISWLPKKEPPVTKSEDLQCRESIKPTSLGPRLKFKIELRAKDFSVIIITTRLGNCGKTRPLPKSIKLELKFEMKAVNKMKIVLERIQRKICVMKSQKVLKHNKDEIKESTEKLKFLIETFRETGKGLDMVGLLCVIKNLLLKVHNKRRMPSALCKVETQGKINNTGTKTDRLEHRIIAFKSCEGEEYAIENG